MHALILYVGPAWLGFTLGFICGAAWCGIWKGERAP